MQGIVHRSAVGGAGLGDATILPESVVKSMKVVGLRIRRARRRKVGLKCFVLGRYESQPSCPTPWLLVLVKISCFGG